MQERSREEGFTRQEEPTHHDPEWSMLGKIVKLRICVWGPDCHM